jgi:hypothetical protein
MQAAWMDLQRCGFVHDDVVVRFVEDGEIRVMRAQHSRVVAPADDDANRCLIASISKSVQGTLRAQFACPPLMTDHGLKRDDDTLRLR